MYQKEANTLISLLLIVALFFLCTEFVKDTLIVNYEIEHSVISENGLASNDIETQKIILTSITRTENEFLYQRQNNLNPNIGSNSNLFIFSWCMVFVFLGILLYIIYFSEKHILFGSKMLLKYIHRADGKMYSKVYSAV